MDVEAFLQEIRARPDYADQIAYVRQVEPRAAAYGDPSEPLPLTVRAVLASRGIERLYRHQAQAIDAIRRGENVLVVSGTASGKSLCYTAPILETLAKDPQAAAMMLFPTKALCQDQFRSFGETLAAGGLDKVLAGVYDGDTPSSTRRRLRDHASVIFTNPDMLHSSVMPVHGRWGSFMRRLKYLVIDELHVYSGIFGSNMTNLLRRLRRVFEHHGCRPQIVMCSATIGNPRQLAEGLTGAPVTVIDTDGSPRGRRTYVFWNPPRLKARNWRSRRSANVEAHELMAALIQRGAPTITFSKAKMTAEMIHRYVTERLRELAPQLASKVTPYRGGYRPHERREIEQQLFTGQLLGVSSTRALELGIDVGGLEASILVGYPGTLASFFQQSGRAGRRDRDALVVLIGLDTTVNQYIMTHPEYLFGRPIEQGILDPDNPFVVSGHLRCTTHESPLPEGQEGLFGPHAETVLKLLEEHHKVRRVEGRWYHAAAETPQHEVSLRDTVDGNVLIEDVASGEVIGEVNRFDAPPILHPGAVYMHRGETYRVLELDLEKNIARIQRDEVDYYTNPLGGTDVHHVDQQLRGKPFGTGSVYWGEVTAYFNNWGYEKIHFYSVETVSVHRVDLPTMMLDTMALWIVPDEDLMERVRRSGLEAHSGLRGIGYATRMLLPLFMTCDTLDFSHSIGSVNTPWNAIFIYERYPLGLGFTAKAYEQLHEVLPRVLENIRQCPCEDGCPCCVGKPLRQYATWYVDLGEASVPSKKAALMILEGLLGDGGNLNNPDMDSASDSVADAERRLEMALRRRMERLREPRAFHPIEPKVKTEYPGAAAAPPCDQADSGRRRAARSDLAKRLRRKLAKKIDTGELDAMTPRPAPPEGMKLLKSMPPTAFPGRPAIKAEKASRDASDKKPPAPIPLGDPLAERARKRKKHGR